MTDQVGNQNIVVLMTWLIFMLYTSRKQVRVMKTPLHPALYSKIGVYRGIHYFNGALLTVYLYLLTPNATFQKAGTCLNAQQSMAKQPIKGCVSNHNRTCGKSVGFRINLKALEETAMFFGEQRILINSSFHFEFLPLSGFWIPLFMLLFSSIF